MQLKDYISGKKRGKEANRLEREAMNDPFLQGALEGFDSVAGDHVKIIERLEKKYNPAATVIKPVRRTLFYWSVAATLLLLIVAGAFLFIERDRQDLPMLADAKIEQDDETSLLNLSESMSIPEAEVRRMERARVAEDARTVSAAPQTPPSVPVAVKRADSSPVSESLLVVADAISSTEVSELSVSIADLQEHKVVVEEPKVQFFRARVVDETGEPIAGASIMEKGTTRGTVTDVDGNFSLQLSNDDSSTLVANYLGYESKEINPSKTDQTVTLIPNDNVLSEVVVVGYGKERRKSVTGAVTTVQAERIDKTQSSFGEKEFQNYCKQNADKNVCPDKNISVNVSFFIDETGKPVKIEFKKYTCEKAKEEVEKLLSTSPEWTKKNRKVTMTIKW